VKNKLKSLYLDTNVGIFFYNNVFLTSTLLSAVPMATLIVVSVLALGATHAPGLIWFVAMAAVGVTLLVVAFSQERLQAIIDRTQERWLDERATGTNPWLQAHPEQY
jgi:hypothetical protein